MRRRLGIALEQAACWVQDSLRRQCEGTFFSTEEEWKVLARSHGITPVPVWNVRDFSAMAHCYAPGKWFLLYNGSASPLTVVGYIVHEIAEILCAGQDPSLWEYWPHTPAFRYDGAPNSLEVRHRVAQLVEKRIMQEIAAER